MSDDSRVYVCGVIAGFAVYGAFMLVAYIGSQIKRPPRYK